jgi:4-hydroxyphenylpyruvate dioxygenase
MHYEGLLDKKEHERRIEELQVWIEVAEALGTDLISIPSSFLPADRISGSMDDIVADFRKVSDLGLRQDPPMRFAYESLCWGTYVDVWEKCWEVVRRVDRSNFGICLDTFNIAGKLYADPALPCGKTTNGEEAVCASMASLASTVDVRKVFLVQLVDAERLNEPLTEGHELYQKDQPPRMSWSRNCRLFYGEQDRGGYLPVKEVAAAIFRGLGYDGWVSAELFNRRMSDTDAEVPEELARRGAISWSKLVKDLRLGVTDSSFAYGPRAFL